MSSHSTLWANHALTADGWQEAVQVDIDSTGTITGVTTGQAPVGERVELLLPAVANLHSHAFQRAMAGMTETRGVGSSDSFWTWRELMYRFLQHLDPDDVEAITAFVQLEMLEAGYTSVGEFHYLHHQPDGTPYQRRAELSERVVAASRESGIGLTLLPVVYERGGCDDRPLAGGQKRFGNTPDEYAELFIQASECIAAHGNNANIGVAPHSLRALGKESLDSALELANGKPFHIHVAEQQAEVDELVEYYGARPVDWLLDNQPLDKRWCLIHATQMTETETERLAATGAVAGLCPITESSLGDGIFNAKNFFDQGGLMGVGSDSNIRISLSEELRTLEYSQRLRDKQRAILATESRSCGRVLFDSVTQAGAQALDRNTGKIKTGMQADLLALDKTSPNLLAVDGDNWLDAWIFASDDRLVTDVWANGVQVVKSGRHIKREAIEKNYRQTMLRLAERI